MRAADERAAAAVRAGAEGAAAAGQLREELAASSYTIEVLQDKIAAASGVVRTADGLRTERCAPPAPGALALQLCTMLQVLPVWCAWHRQWRCLHWHMRCLEPEPLRRSAIWSRAFCTALHCSRMPAAKTARVQLPFGRPDKVVMILQGSGGVI